MKLNEKQTAKLKAIANDSGYTGPLDSAGVRAWKRIYAAKIKACDRMLAILAPPKKVPTMGKNDGLGK